VKAGLCARQKGNEQKAERGARELKARLGRVDDVGEQAMYSDNAPDIHRTQPPGGKLDLVYRGQQRGREARPQDPLHVCFHCAGELVYPLDWTEEGPRHWRIVLRCPECESTREGVFEQTAVELLDDELDRGAGALLGDLKRITHANMTEEIEFFVRALDADLIVPSDF
jgi:hypothetical protein